jgi:hypothetical protein
MALEEQKRLKEAKERSVPGLGSVANIYSLQQGKL